MAEKKSASEKAREALDVANRKVERLQARRDKAKADLESLGAELETATKERDYIAQHPALTPLPSEATTEPEAAVAEAGGEPLPDGGTPEEIGDDGIRKGGQPATDEPPF